MGDATLPQADEPWQDAGMKTYGQIAYEAGSAFWLERGDGPEGGFAAWEDIDQQDRDYWEAVANAVIHGQDPSD